MLTPAYVDVVNRYYLLYVKLVLLLAETKESDGHRLAGSGGNLLRHEQTSFADNLPPVSSII